MTFAEKHRLGQNIRFLNKEHLKGIVPIVKDHSNPSKEVLEFDLKELSTRKCRELEQYVLKCM